MTILRLVLLVAILMGLPNPVHAAPGSWRELRIETGGRVTEVLARDINGDGRGDILIQRGRELRLHLQGDKGLRNEPDQAWRLDPRAAVFDVGDLDGNNVSEIITITGAGVFVQHASPTGLFSLRKTQIIQVPTALRRASTEEVRRKELLRDVDGDGAVDLLFPSVGGLFWAKGTGKGGFSRPRNLTIPPDATLVVGTDEPSSKVISGYWYPNLYRGRWNDDPYPDLFCQSRNRMFVFPGNANGIASRPSFNNRLTTLKKRKPGTRPWELDFTLPMAFEDLNQDNRTDFLITHISKGQIAMFRGAGKGTQLTKPHQVIQVPGLALLQELIDLTGDGLPELIIPRSDPIGIWTLVEVLLSKEVDIEIMVFRNLGDKGFETLPAYKRKVTIPLLISGTARGMRLGTSLVLSADGDSTGDGINDLVVREDDNHLAIYPGKGDCTFSEEPAARIPVHPMGTFQYVDPRAVDINGDDRDDIVLVYHSWDRTQDRVSILLSGETP